MRGRESEAIGKNPPQPRSQVEKTQIDHSLARRQRASNADMVSARNSRAWSIIR